MVLPRNQKLNSYTCIYSEKNLESFQCALINRGGSSISDKGVHITYKGVCVWGGRGGSLCWFYLIFYRIFKNGGQRGGLKPTPSGSATAYKSMCAY